MRLLLFLFIISPQLCFAQKQVNNPVSDSQRVHLKKLAFVLQNRGQLLDEREHLFKEAHQYIDSAIQIFTLLNDSLNLANNLKLIGYLKARLGNFTQGKIEVAKAIELFTLKKAKWGVAVSQFDRARIYYLENNLDSAVQYCNLAIEYWRSKNDTDRIFINQTLLIATYLKANDYTKAKAIHRASQTLLQAKEQHWQNLLNFYVVSQNLYAGQKDVKQKAIYDSKLVELTSWLRKEQIYTLTFF